MTAVTWELYSTERRDARDLSPLRGVRARPGRRDKGEQRACEAARHLSRVAAIKFYFCVN